MKWPWYKGAVVTDVGVEPSSVRAVSADSDTVRGR